MNYGMYTCIWPAQQSIIRGALQQTAWLCFEGDVRCWRGAPFMSNAGPRAVSLMRCSYKTRHPLVQRQTLHMLRLQFHIHPFVHEETASRDICALKCPHIYVTLRWIDYHVNTSVRASATGKTCCDVALETNADNAGCSPTRITWHYIG